MSGIYPASIGGPEVYIYYLSRELASQNNELHIFTRVENRNDLNKLKHISEEIPNVQIYPLVMKYNISNLLNLPVFLRQFKQITQMFKKTVKKLDVIHYNAPPVDIAFIFALFAKRHSKIQTYFLHHGLFAEMGDILSNYGMPAQFEIVFQNLFRFLAKMKFFTRVIVPNNYALNLAIKNGVSKAQTCRIRVGVDISRFQKADPFNLKGKPKILFVGRLAKIKGIDVLLKAFNKLLPKYPESILYILGKGEYRHYLERLAQKLDIEKSVNFLGFVSDDDLPRYLKSCDIFVVSSFRENQPITILEAMASQIPVIATNIEGIDEIIKHEENGLLVPKNDIESLAIEIIRLLEDRQLFDALTKNGFTTVEKNHSYKHIGSKFTELFEELLKNR